MKKQFPGSNPSRTEAPLEYAHPEFSERWNTIEANKREDVAQTILGVKQELERAAKANNSKWHQEILDRYEYRRGSLSEFMKTLKQRFTQWYNRTHRRKGTIWEARYKSVLVEDTESALLTMAAYIDLNPVRAGMVASPEDYRWCG